eukprot:jgi/Ulvmu1/8853/UM049_0035.1
MLAVFGRLRLSLAYQALRWSRSMSTGVGEGLVEIRDYTIKPEYFNEYIDESAVASEVRTKHMPFLGMFTPEVGGVLNRTVHMYAYADMNERERTRKAMLDRAQWCDFLSRSRPYVIGPQVSFIMREAAPIYEALNMKATKDFEMPDDGIKGMYEIRQYQLHPGYGTVPKVVDELVAGLPHKIASSEDGTPVFFGFTELGTLNTFVEIWRYRNSHGCMAGRGRSRTAPEWKAAVANIAPHVQLFHTALMRPLWFSPWQ